MKTMTRNLMLGVFSLILAACGGAASSLDPSTSGGSSLTGDVLTTITISGANDATVEFDTPFNLRTGVTATGNNGVDYTSALTLTSISTAVNTTTGVLDTKQTGTHTIRYEARVGDVVASRFRNITVSQPESTGMLVNPDFSLGTAGWNDPSVVYIADGAEMTLSVVSGELKVDVVSGFNFFTPRFGQMNIPFEQGKTYEVSFDARSSVNKEIALQVGELLPAAPWFNDFLPSAEPVIFRTITTSMQRYSYKFTMNQNNQKGGILFGLGRVNNQSINATMYFDNIDIVETVMGADTTPPVFLGIAEDVTLTVGSAFDPIEGVTAVDVVDGDLTAAIVVTIRNAADEVVTSIDTSSPGVFTVTYEVTDAAGNKATRVTTVTILALDFVDENLIVNGDFTQTLGNEFTFFTQDWDNAPVVSRSQDVTAGTYTFTISNGGGVEPWAIQMNQEGIDMVEGQTYLLSITGFGQPGRSISAAFISGAPDYINYARRNGMSFGTTSTTQDLLFTFTQSTRQVILTIELGTQPGFANGDFTFENIRLQRLEGPRSLVANPNFESLVGHEFFTGSGGGMSLVSGGALINVPALGGNPWEPHYFTIIDAIAPGTYEFKLVIRSNVKRDFRFIAVLPDAGFSSILPTDFVDFGVEANETYTFTTTIPVMVPLTNLKLELDFGPIAGLTTIPGEFLLSEVLLYRNFN
jgi:hypothetical protein